MQFCLNFHKYACTLWRIFKELPSIFKNSLHLFDVVGTTPCICTSEGQHVADTMEFEHHLVDPPLPGCYTIDFSSHHTGTITDKRLEIVVSQVTLFQNI